MANRYLYLARHGEAIDDGDLSEAGRQQARLLGQRLAGVGLSAVHHGPLPRSVRTAQLVGEQLPTVPLHAEDIVGDYVPPVSNRDGLPEVYARFLNAATAGEPIDEEKRADAAIARYARSAESETRELIITHGFLIGWFVRHALDAPDWRWIGLNAANGALTTILYREDRPPTLLTFNDMGHLPAELRWTGFRPELRV